MSHLSVSEAALRRVLGVLLSVERGARGRAGPKEANVEALQRATRLARGTVHNALSYLAPVLQQRSYRPQHSVGGRGGKPTILHKIAPKAAEALVLQFEHDRVAIFSADAAGSLSRLGIKQVDVDRDPESAIEEACKRIAQLDEKGLVYWERIVGFGVSIPAPVDPDTQRVIGGVLPAWEAIDVAGLISEHLGAKVADLPVIADNDGNLATLAEYRYGERVDLDAANLFFVKTVPGAIGIGAGAVIHGRPLRGGGLAMEFGHLPVDTSYRPLVREFPCPHCQRKNCLQARLSTQALIPKPTSGSQDCQVDLETPWETVVERALSSVVSLNAGRHAAVEGGDVKAVTEADTRMNALRRDPDLEAIVFAAQEMGRALAKVVTLIDPEIITIGGPLGSAWLGTGPRSLSSAIGDPLRESLWEHVPLSQARTICLREATVTDESARGAAAAVFDEHLIKFLLDRAAALASGV
jgi:predicted NBD/HSP70 family sugar kinase